ncbi:hypothetical protein [Planomonospora sp. ID82291]|uniref:hypothetical protein n=1 Tax=Planomonospora sp. ID82291 TaxID=2738136 RepID=UPI0018C3FDD1|nr:hypothetical protein [Planomonospora sp. ID82291]MBG0818346.1 hypothetical protein [Planomonospora sp. ID82291]
MTGTEMAELVRPAEAHRPAGPTEDEVRQWLECLADQWRRGQVAPPRPSWEKAVTELWVSYGGQMDLGSETPYGRGWVTFHARLVDGRVVVSTRRPLTEEGNGRR